MYYLMWLDDTRNRSVADKIAGGCAAYRERFGVAPTVVLVNERDRVEIEGMRVEARQTVQANQFWLGQEGS